MTQEAASAAARVDAGQLRAALEVLSAHPSPRGGELELAQELAQWAEARWPALNWEVVDLGDGAANLIARSNPDTPDQTLVYSHLDTSLTGDVLQDAPITGRTDPLVGLKWDESSGQTSGFGLAVAKAPAAAALIGYAAAAMQRAESGCSDGLALLLASSGTHGSKFANPDEELRRTGVEHYFDSGQRPTEVIVAKSGPAGLLCTEPGASYLRVRISGSLAPAMFASTTHPVGGLTAQLPVLMGAISSWREDYLAGPAQAGHVAAEIAIGSVVAGSPRKPDLLPAAMDVHLYAMTTLNDDAEQIAHSLRTWLEKHLSNTPLADCPVQVDFSEEAVAAGTDPGARVVRRAAEAWECEFGAPPAMISDWKGSTDGVVFRAWGSQTVRLGPMPVADPLDGRRDVVQIDVLVACARIYARLGWGSSV